jgi:hypothetical protein
LGEKVAPKGSDEGSLRTVGLAGQPMRRAERDPSFVGFAATFSPKREKGR